MNYKDKYPYLDLPEDEWPKPSTCDEIIHQAIMHDTRDQGLNFYVTDPVTVHQLATLIKEGNKA